MNEFQKLSESASKYEKKRNYHTASILWGEASMRANNPRDIEWATSRKNYCRKQLPVGLYV